MSNTNPYTPEPETDQPSVSQLVRWQEYFVGKTESKARQLPSAVVLLERTEGEDIVEYSAKYFTNVAEAIAFAKVIGEFLSDTLLEFDLVLRCQTPHLDLVYPFVIPQ